MKLAHLIAIAVIFVCTTFAWWFLGGTINYRTNHVASQTGDSVSGRWGPTLMQKHPGARYTSSSGGKVTLQPAKSDVKVKLDYQPVKMGLLWHRTYGVTFDGSYTFTNSTAITQTLEIDFELPSANALLDKIKFTLGAGEKARDSIAAPEQGVITDSVQLAPGESIPITVSYECRGMDFWRYAFADASRIRDFTLTMNTDFSDVNFPISSPTDREPVGKGMQLIWKYEDAISAPGIGMEMPRELNAGPVAAQISFYAPLSLLLFFAVIIITAISRGVSLHPVNYVFLAAGFFAFPLLFSYMLDVVPVHLSFVIAASASLLLVCGYLRAAAGEFLFRVSVVAQTAYMVLFSYSFFFKGLTGLTLTLGGIVTLGVLMALTAKVDWSQKLGAVSPRLA
ncbi:MAG: inner membrane CreD family protein [Prosthecobacter sp.]|uniref:inner membrane CreD family protein n=1 Tax=Prosthecobacter sp. TaxID=1965333 RepID=UPI0039019BF1